MSASATGLHQITVLGGAGFLGYHLARRWGASDTSLTLADIAPFRAAEYPSGVQTRYADVRDSRSLMEAIRGSEVVIHAAAALPSWGSKTNHHVNVEGTRNVLEACVKAGVPRVVYVSSSAVYGMPQHPVIDEDHPLVGFGAYGESKIQAEHLCVEYRRRGLCVPILRPGTFIGSGRLGIFQILYDWVRCGKRIPMIGQGSNRYQLLEVSELVEAIEFTATAAADQANDTFNVGAGAFQTVAEDLRALCAAAGSGADVLPTPARLVKSALAVFEVLHLSPLHRWMYSIADQDHVLSTAKIEERLGWRSRISNAQALIASYRWYLEHEHELTHGTGLTHRERYEQGILGIVRRWA